MKQKIVVLQFRIKNNLMKIGITIGMWLVIIILCYFVYDSIAGKIRFEAETKNRRDFVIERLKDIRVAQFAYKTVNNKYAASFDTLLNFVNNASFPVIKAIGTVPDTLSESEAVSLGLVRRDTVYINVKDSIFSLNKLKGHLFPFKFDSLPYIPFGQGEKFKMQAGEIEVGKAIVNVFEVFASFEVIYSGLDTKDEPIDLSEGLKVGSMTETSTSGNWGE